MKSISNTVIAMFVAAAAFLFLLLVGVHYWQKSHSQAAQSRVEQGQSGAYHNSSADAVNTVAASGEREAASEALTRSNEQDIRAAAGSNTVVPAAASRAGRAAYCKREAYMNKPYCKDVR